MVKTVVIVSFDFQWIPTMWCDPCRTRVDSFWNRVYLNSKYLDYSSEHQTMSYYSPNLCWRKTNLSTVWLEKLLAQTIIFIIKLVKNIEAKWSRHDLKGKKLFFSNKLYHQYNLFFANELDALRSCRNYFQKHMLHWTQCYHIRTRL